MDAQNAHDHRYDIADEYMEVVYKLWEGSWEDDAVVRDRGQRIFARPDKVHKIHHHGENYRVDAIHLCEPSPQRTPLLYQAGASNRGCEFAARHAEFRMRRTRDGLKAAGDAFEKAAASAFSLTEEVKTAKNDDEDSRNGAPDQENPPNHFPLPDARRALPKRA